MRRCPRASRLCPSRAAAARRCRSASPRHHRLRQRRLPYSLAAAATLAVAANTAATAPPYTLSLSLSLTRHHHSQAGITDEWCETNSVGFPMFCKCDGAPVRNESSSSAQLRSDATAKPNILLVLTDDHGFTDITGAPDPDPAPAPAPAPARTRTRTRTPAPDQVPSTRTSSRRFWASSEGTAPSCRAGTRRRLSARPPAPGCSAAGTRTASGFGGTARTAGTGQARCRPT